MGYVRNFWLKARIDGRETTLEGGPRSREGEFSQTIYIRDKGDIVTGVNISGSVDREGRLRLEVYPGAGRHIEQDGHGFAVVTDRDKAPEPKRARRTRSAR